MMRPVPCRLASRLIVCAALCVAVAGCGSKPRAELRVSLEAVPNHLPGKWDAAVKVSWNGDASARRLTVALPKNGSVDVVTVPGPAAYRMSVLIEPVDHSSASGTCQRDLPVLPKERVHATIHVDSRGSCTIEAS
jgi:hypothetical protein